MRKNPQNPDFGPSNPLRGGFPPGPILDPRPPRGSIWRTRPGPIWRGPNRIDPPPGGILPLILAPRGQNRPFPSQKWAKSGPARLEIGTPPTLTPQSKYNIDIEKKFFGLLPIVAISGLQTLTQLGRTPTFSPVLTRKRRIRAWGQKRAPKLGKFNLFP